jgi:uncharacterized membrane protein required for colicin V production
MGRQAKSSRQCQLLLLAPCSSFLSALSRSATQLLFDSSDSASKLRGPRSLHLRRVNVMQNYDLIMVAVLAGTALYGYWKGLAWQVASIASIILSYFVALNSHSFTPKFGLQPPLDTAASMLTLYLGSSAGVWIGFGFISKSLKAMKLKDWDHQAGALVGAVKGALFCMLITIFAMTLGPKEWGAAIPKSISGRYIAVALSKTQMLLPKDIQQTIAKYVDPVKSHLQSGQEDSSLAGTNILSDLEKAGGDLYTKAKDQITSQVGTQAKKGTEDVLRDLGKSVSDRLPNLTPSNSGSSAPRGETSSNPLSSLLGSKSKSPAEGGSGSQNAPFVPPTTRSPLGAPRAENAGRPSVRMPDFSSKRWQRK